MRISAFTWRPFEQRKNATLEERRRAGMALNNEKGRPVSRAAFLSYGNFTFKRAISGSRHPGAYLPALS